jgi:hypothetical protein
MKVKGMNIIAPVSMGLAALIVFWTGWTSLEYAVVLIFAGSIVFGAISKVKIGKLEALWYVGFIIFELVMTAISNDGYTGSPVPQVFTFIQGTLVVFVVTILVFYPLGIISGFKEQFSHKTWTDPYKDMASEPSPTKTSSE